MGGGQPPIGLLGGDGVVSRRVAALVLVLALAGCTDAEDPGSAADRRTPSSTSTSPEPGSSPDSSALAPTPASTPASTPALPPKRACYRLDFDQALAAVSRARPRPCAEEHTARTIAVGQVAELVEGSVGSIDGARSQRAVAAECPRRLAAFLGGPEQALRLSMFRPVWFTPSLVQAERGAGWYRCDVIALAAEGRLAPLEGRLEGMLGRSPAWKATYGLCATAEPGTEGFHRVACGSPHTWRALTTVPIDARRYPGVDAVRDLGTTPCTDAARAVAEDALDFRWGYEWPTLEQWRAGRRYGVCWAPAA